MCLYHFPMKEMVFAPGSSCALLICLLLFLPVNGGGATTSVMCDDFARIGRYRCFLDSREITRHNRPKEDERGNEI